MLNVFDKEFKVLCFIIDKTVLTGKCTYDETINEFGDKIINYCIYNKKTIRKSPRDQSVIELTDFGRREIN